MPAAMLKHSLNHYGSTGAPLQSPQHLTHSSSHSGDTSMHHVHVTDPTRFLEGPPHHTHSHSYLDPYSPGAPTGLHNSSRLFLDTSRISHHNPLRKDDSSSHHYQNNIHLQNHLLHHHHHNDQPSSKPRLNGGIYFSPNQVSPPTRPNPVSAHTTTTNVTSNGEISKNQKNHQPNNTTAATSMTTSPHALSASSNRINLTSTVLTNSAAYRHGVLRSLSLLSVLSLLLALNSLSFLLKNPFPDYRPPADGSWNVLFEVTLSLTALSLSINLCVLLVCSAQYFFAASGTPGSTSFLYKVTVIRGAAIGGFFLSIPLFLCAIILYTFTQFNFSPAVVIASACIGVAIIYGGISMVYHVYTWQREKTAKHVLAQGSPGGSHAPLSTIELSTLV